MDKPLTPTMETCLDFARRNGGDLHRHPGGYWSTPDFQNTPEKKDGTDYFGTQTIFALVARGKLAATEKKKNAQGEFAVKVSIITDWNP